MKEPSTGKPWKRRLKKWLIGIGITVVGLPLLILLLLQLSPVQDFVRGKAENYLRKKLGTEVHIGRLRFTWWHDISLRDVSLKDKKEQTLFATGELEVRYNLLALLSNELRVYSLQWNDAKVNVYRPANDSAFNYQFIIDAFASPTPEKDTVFEESGTTMKYDIGEIDLRRINLAFNDTLGGMLVNADLKLLHLEPEKLDMDNGAYYIDEFKIDGLTASFIQKYIPSVLPKIAEPEPVDTGSSPFDIRANNLLITNTSVKYASDGVGIDVGGNIGKLQLKNARFDLLQTLVDAQSLVLHETTVNLRMAKGLDTTGASEPEDTSSPNTWRITAETLDVAGVNFNMDNADAVPLKYKNALDFNHMALANVVLKADHISYNADSALAHISTGSLTEKSGIQLKELKGKVLYTSNEVNLGEFLLQTAESKIDADVLVRTRSWSTLSDNLPMLQIKADIRPTSVALKEALYFVPDMASNASMKPLWRKRLDLKGNINGSLAQLQIPGLEVKDTDHNYLYVKGSASNVTETDKLGIDLQQVKVLSSNYGIRTWVPAGTIPNTVQLPNRMQIDGSVRGGMQQLHPNLLMTTDFGNLSVKGDVGNFTDPKKLSYSLTLIAQQLQTGRFIRDTTLGALNGTIFAKGSGTEPKTANADARIDIRSFTYNRYTYQNIVVDGGLHKGAYQATGKADDPAVQVTFDVSGKIDSLRPDIAANVDLQRFDMHATGFSADTMTVKAILEAKVNSLQPRKLDAYANVFKIQVADKSQIYALDSILVRADADSGLQRITLRAPFGRMRIAGDFNYQTVASTAQAIIERHLSAASNLPPVPTEKQQLAFNGALFIPKSLEEFFPDIQLDKPLFVSGRLNSDSALLAADLNLPRMRYDSFFLDTFRVKLRADTTIMTANMVLGKLSHPSIPLERTTIDAKAQNGLLDFDLQINDHDDNAKYKLGGNLHYLEGDSLLFSLKEKILLNKMNWTAAGGNRVVVKSGNLSYADIGFQQQDQLLRVFTPNAATDTLLPDITVELKNFRLSTLTSIVEKDTALVNGIANGAITVKNLSVNPLLDGDLKVDSLRAMGTSIGDLALKANSTEDKSYNLEARITGNGNDVELEGTYGKEMDFTLSLQKLNVKTLEPFTFGNVEKMSGAANGRITLRGTMDAPNIRGHLHFDDAAGTVTMINNEFKLPNEDIEFVADGIRFNQFVIADSAGNEAVLNGRIRTVAYRDFNFNLTLKAENFRALGPKAHPDQLYYGPAYIDLTARVQGDLDLPRVQLNVKLREKSEVTVVIPEDKPGIESREGIMEFVDRDNMPDSSLLTRIDSLPSMPTLKGIVFSGDVEIDPKAIMRIVIDPGNGDYLEVQGNATLNLTLDPSNKMSLTGRYEIDEGKYAMSLNQLIKRQFEIEKGSTIIWNGEATSADVNIRAKYAVNAPAIDLIGDQVTDATTNKAQYNQKVPVEVFLIITGELLKPEIAFELDMPENSRNVLDGALYTRLKQINQVPSELNKQVMGLLILNRFISENPFDQLDSRTGSSFEDIARKSVSKVLSQQLNNLAGSLIKGFDVNFDLQSEDDYSTGTKTESTNLKVDVSKRLLNDRLTVTVGSNVGITGNGDPQEASTLVGDVSAEYTLTRDGRYRLRAYRRNLSETIIEGEVVETGLSFMLVVDYDRFREIFERRREKKQERIRAKKSN
ncbi:translocation/assembly module TamB domain-containing protein [uncultured Chitinophaga sp.]|uniref:translocation/assembly module TamB domain-containing protein n=1 Tax=uncultured Chitinophaga sp. TaxID=339340 RepID=UPI0025D88709|nr:translocation/assembly module TamB domain-containing protein [uncultured Chitinophaga sp.]